MGVWRTYARHGGIELEADFFQMMSPKAPLANKQLIWHMYSGQAYGVRAPILPFVHIP